MHGCTVAFGSGWEGGTCWGVQRFLKYVASLFLGAMAGDAFASGVRRFGQSRSVVKFNEEHADMILARDTALHEAARLGGELASAQERSASVAGEMHHELDKCVSERDAALRQADSFQKELESAQQEREIPRPQRFFTCETS